jgi:hypothetical protein
VFRPRNLDDLAPAFTPAIFSVRVLRFKSGATDCVPFGLSLISIFGLLKCNDAYGSSLCIGHVTKPDPPTALMLVVVETSSRSSLPSWRGGMLSRQLPTRPLPVAPVPVELLQTELQV